jgi:ribosomal 50S subunit-recycling heat shock protein
LRLDKFLKVSRVIKRRPVAKTVIDNKKAKLNGKVAKSGTEVKTGDILELEYFNRYFKIEILDVPSGNVSKDKAQDLVKIQEVKELERPEEEEIF